MTKPTAIIVRCDRTIPPFDEPARDVLVLNEKLSAYQDRILSALGFEVRRVDRDEGLTGRPTLVFDENLFFSPEFLREFLERSQASKAPTTRACLKKGVFTKQVAVLQPVDEGAEHLPFPLYWCGGDSLDEEGAEEVILDVDEHFESGNFPNHMLGKDSFRFSVTTRPILAITEALHIGLVNVAANLARLARLRRPGLFGILRATVAALTSFSLDRTTIKARALRALSTIHPSAEVHPTAVIEGSTIGPRAKVGAYAVIRFSVVGEGAFVDDHAGLKFSVIGDGAYIANNNVLFFTTAYPGAFLISGPYQFCCFGYDTAIMNSIPADYRLDGKTIKVKTSEGLQDTGLRFAGSIIGHGTRIAAGLIFAPGRAIPRGLTLYPDPARVAGHIDPNLNEKGQVWFLKDGCLTSAPLERKKNEGNDGET